MQETLQHIPLFPLNIFLLPGEQIPLHIFEPRYRQLFEEAEQQGLRFGLPFLDKKRNKHLVSVCKLLKVTKSYKTGEKDVIVEAERLAVLSRYENVFPEKLYPGGYVSLLPNDDDNQWPGPELMKVFKEYLRLRYGTDPLHSNVAHYRVFDIAASIALSNEDKLSFIAQSITDAKERLLVNNIKYLNLLLQQEQKIENGIILN